MKVGDILQEKAILVSLRASDKENALREVAEHMATQLPHLMLSASTVYEALVTREHLGSTGVGEGVAIPHAKLPGLLKLTACFARAAHAIEFDSIDFKPVRLMFVLLVPEDCAGTHLKALAKVSRFLKNPRFRTQLLAGTTQKQLFEAFVQEDETH